MANKKTLKDYFVELREMAETNGRDDLVGFINDRIEQIEKKNANRSGKLTKEQEKNEVLKAEIVSILTACDAPNGMTVTDIMKSMTEEWSLNKVNALVTALKKAEVVTRTEVKGKAYFSLN